MSSNPLAAKNSFKDLLGLGVGGSKAELAKRIDAHIAATATTSDLPESGDPDPCDVIVAADVEYGDEGDMRAGATVALQAELNSQEL